MLILGGFTYGLNAVEFPAAQAPHRLCNPTRFTRGDHSESSFPVIEKWACRPFQWILIGQGKFGNAFTGGIEIRIARQQGIRSDSSRIGADHLKIFGSINQHVANTGWYDDHIAFDHMNVSPIFASKQQSCSSARDTEHLMIGAMEMMIWIDGPPPSGGPAVRFETIFEPRGRILEPGC